MRADTVIPLLAIVALGLVACEPAETSEPDAEPGPAATSRSDPRAIEIAEAVLQRMGGRESWERTRVVSWKFFGGRQHYWDRASGDVRIEADTDDGKLLWLMNVNTKQGRVWKDGEEVAGEELTALLDRGWRIWINDSYWMFMPYKLLDPGVTLQYSGKMAMQDGRTADVLDLTFDEGVGVTPQNRYEVFVARDTGLVEQWSFYTEAAEEEPRFTLPWSGWERFGEILLATDHGEEKDWRIAVHDGLDPSVFRDPALVTR